MNDHGLHLEGLHDTQTEAAAIRGALTELFIASMEVAASLIGYDLVAPMIRRIDAAEVRNA